MSLESDKIIPLFKIITSKVGGSVSHRFKLSQENVDNSLIRIVYIGFSIDYELLHNYELAQKLSKCFNLLKFKEIKDDKTNECLVIFDKEYVELINLALEYAKTGDINILSNFFKKLGIVHYLSDEYLVIGLRSENISKEHVKKLAKKFKVYEFNTLDRKVIFIGDKYENELSILFNVF